MEATLVAGLTVYGPLGIAVAGLALALIFVYKRSDTKAGEYEKNLGELHKAYATKLETFHAERRAEVERLHETNRVAVAKLYEQQTEVLQELLTAAHKAMESNNEFVGQLSTALERLTSTDRQGPKQPEAPKGRGRNQ